MFSTVAGRRRKETFSGRLCVFKQVHRANDPQECFCHSLALENISKCTGSRKDEKKKIQKMASDPYLSWILLGTSLILLVVSIVLFIQGKYTGGGVTLGFFILTLVVGVALWKSYTTQRRQAGFIERSIWERLQQQ